jgi:uncharacterized repeat protein (TIGR01451 family)
MNGKQLHVQSRRPFSSVLGLAFMLSLMAFGERPLFAIATSPAPRVWFDQNPPPPIPPDVPPQVLIGEDFTFRVRFKNDNPIVNAALRATGYGPFIDLVLDAGGANMAKTQPCACDGMKFVQANMIDVNGGAVPLVNYQNLAPCAPSSSLVPLNHPFAGVSPVYVPAGSQLVTLELPFGSFDPSQPEIVVEVTAHVSPLADEHHPLNIFARGGFRYGEDALDNPNTDWPVLSDLISTPPPNNQQINSTLWAAKEQTIPLVIIVSKKYLGPEDETATGPNFIQRYAITLDIATGQKVTNVKVTDSLPSNMAYYGMVTPLPSCFTVTPPVPPAVGGTLVLECPLIIGVPGPDATIVFEFFIPEFDSTSAPILHPNSCDPVRSNNYVEAEGNWTPTPIDPCDTSPPVQVGSNMFAYPLFDKCLAIQKTVLDLSGASPAHPIPGDTLLYTLNFQLSDFRTAGNLKLQDVLSDGQTLVPGSLMLTVADQCGTTTGAIPSAYWTAPPLPCAAGAPPPRTQLNIDVSAAMNNLGGHPGGILTGGYATSATPNLPARGMITFQTVIDDQYQCSVAFPHDQFVDKDDPLTNTVSLTADILPNGAICLTTTNPTGVIAQDLSKVELLIATDFLEKTVYQVQGVAGHPTSCGPTPPCPNKPEVYPGDLVTFRLKKTIPSSDAESLTIQDWLPLPIFNVPSSFTLTSATCGSAIPASGFACQVTLPTWTWGGPSLTLTLPPTTNSITFNYGTFYASDNQPRTIDLLFTLTVSNDPFADGLYLTNEARECESNTFGVTFCQTAIAQLHVREPALKITKGIVAASNPNAVFSPPPVAPVTFHAPGTSCPRFNGTINSTNLASTPINSDISSVDANDCVTFAIVVENTGGSPAYDIKLRDLFPVGATDAPDCFAPDFTTLCVTDGTGTPIPFTPGTASHGNLPITLQSPLPGVSSPPGSNIALITFDACIVGNIKPHCCDNTATVENYASTQGGPNFVAAGFGGQLQDTAKVCVLPKASKSITTTSEAHTPGTPPGPALSPEQLAIGEVIRYHLKVLVPETTSASHYQLQDVLPAGLSYLPGPTTIFSPLPSGVSASNFPPQVTRGSTCGGLGGGPILFDFGNVTNSSPNTSAQEFIELEFNALVCNIFSNHSGTALNNSLVVLVDSQQGASSAVSAVVVEPQITITKVAAASSLTAGAIATYTITLANNATAATATAFDVRLTDLLPACLTKLTIINITPSGGVTDNSNPTMLDLTIARIPVNGTVTVQYSASVTCVDCSKLINTAKVTWTSLPGPLGTTPNLTLSSPGASGLPNGERDGSGGVNSYAASATATLCCMLVSNERINCNSDGTFTYAFTVTNFSTSTVSGVSFAPPAGVTITPSSIAAALPPGGSTSVTVTIGGPGAISGESICFTVVLFQAVVVCRTDQCITLPKCCVQPPSGMVAWYALDELQGATAVNDIAPPPSSSFNNVGTPKPGPVGAGGPVPVAGKVIGALYFTGKPYVEVPPQNDLNFGAGSFSIDGWVRAAGCGPGQLSPIVDKLDVGANTGFSFYLDQPSPGSAVLKLRVNASTFASTSSITANANPLLNTGPWFHIAVTLDVSAGVGAFYIDGSPAGSFTTSTGPFTNTVPMWIGQTRVSGDQCEIAIDELEIFNRALSQAEIQGISNAGSAGKCWQSDLAITKRAANTPWTVGGTGTFTLLVQNLGPGAVPAGTVINVTENLPAGLTLTSVSGSGWASIPTSGAGPLVVTCQYTVPSAGLPAGGSLPPITFTGIVTSAGPFANCASVQGQLAGAILQQPTSNDTSCITIPTGSGSPVVVQIPVVLDVFGVSPAHYTSDLVAVNRSGASTPLTVSYIPAPGTPGAGGPAVSVSLGSGQEWRVPDVLAFLRASGYPLPPTGPLEAGILRLTFQGVSDPSLVFAGSRATTPNPNATVGGSFGLFLTGTPVGFAPSQSATIFALREDTAYRSNLAIEDVPGGSGPPVLTLQVVNGNTGSLSGTPITYALGPGEWHQFNSILGSVANGYVTITKTGGGSDRFLAYGVVNDGPASGGGTSDGSLVGMGAADGLVPIVLSVTSSGVLYTTELVLANPTATSAIATLIYTPAATLGGSGGPYTANVLVGARQQVRVADVITWLRDTLLMPLPASGMNQGGTLLVSGATAYVRTSNPNPDTVVGGTFGLAYPAVPASGRAWTEAWVYGLVQDTATRTNVAIADARAGDSTVVTYVLEIFNADTGSPTPVATVNIPLAGGQWSQATQVLSGTGVTHGYVRVRPLSSGTSDYVVYGVLNDGASPGQATSDGSYVAMSGVQ